MSQSKLETIFASDPGLSDEAIAWFENVHRANDDYVALLHSPTSERQNGLASKFGHLSPGFDEPQQFVVNWCFEWTVGETARSSKTEMVIGASFTTVIT